MTSKPAHPDSKLVLDLPWFQVHAVPVEGGGDPYYSISTFDFAVVVATDEQGRLLLVRQFRHAIQQWTLEPPAGHVDAGETPEQSARKELMEETGHEADTLELLTVYTPCTARYTNKLYVFFAPNVRVAKNPKHALEEGMQPVLYDKGIRALVDEKEFYSAGAHAAVFAAVARGKILLGM